MQVLDNYYLNGVNNHKKTEPTGNQKTILDPRGFGVPIVKNTLADQLNSAGNLQFYPNQLNLSNSYIMNLTLLQKAFGLDKEHWFWSKLHPDNILDFSEIPHLTCRNRRRKRLAGWIEKLTRLWGRQICPHENTYMVDSIPVHVTYRI